MSQNVKICDIDPALKEKVKKFSLRKEKNNAAIIMKIDKENLVIKEDTDLTEEADDYDDLTIEELKCVLPDHQARYMVYTYELKHDDGRVSYPLCFIFYSPSGCKPEMQMMYAGSKTELVNGLGMTKVFEIRSLDELTEDWLKSKIVSFR